MGIDQKSLLLYAITDRTWTGRQTLLEQVEDALRGGATLVQLREKDLSEAAFLQEAVQMKALCRRYGVPLIINDNLAVALKSGADGIHVGMEDTPVGDIRAQVGPDFIIGATAKTVAQARQAQTAGADYLGVGAVFPSPTKQNALRVSTEELRRICTSVSIPAVAIGGIGPDNLAQLQGGGMRGIAVVSALFGAEDVHAAAQALRRQVEALVNN